VGTGWWATRAHLPALERNPNAVIAAIADPNEVNRRRAAERFGVPGEHAYPDVAAMLAGTTLDGAIVAIPHVFHAPVTRTLLEHGLPVLLEKPMTIDPADARELEALARERGVELIVGYPWQYNAHVRELRGEIAGGRIGEVEVVACVFAATAREIFRSSSVATTPGEEPPFIAPQPDTYADARISGGGQGQTLTTHMAALLIWLLGRPAVEVIAVVDRRDLALDLVNALILRFEGGALATITSTGSLPGGEQESLEVRLFGTTGHIHLAITDGEATIHRVGESPISLDTLPVSERTPEGAPADDLVEVVLGRKPSGSPGWVGVAAVELVDAMYRSARSGQAVRLRDPERSDSTRRGQSE
jgi:predicted dehydrogenase